MPYHESVLYGIVSDFAKLSLDIQNKQASHNFGGIGAAATLTNEGFSSKEMFLLL